MVFIVIMCIMTLWHDEVNSMLSFSLQVGMDKAIGKLTVPLGQLKEEVLVSLTVVL